MRRCYVVDTCVVGTVLFSLANRQFAEIILGNTLFWILPFLTLFVCIPMCVCVTLCVVCTYVRVCIDTLMRACVGARS